MHLQQYTNNIDCINNINKKKQQAQVVTHHKSNSLWVERSPSSWKNKTTQIIYNYALFIIIIYIILYIITLYYIIILCILCINIKKRSFFQFILFKGGQKKFFSVHFI